MDKLKMESLDITKCNIEKIGTLFPNVLTETKDENGNIVKAINFDKLKQELTDDIVDGSDESYDFTWVGKTQAIIEANTPIRKTLRPVVEDETVPTGADSNGNPYISSGSKNFDTTENLYIEGDNLEVLKLLQESYLNSIKMIYIDPPYNTGKDSFVYPDNFTMDKDEYEEETQYRDEDGNVQFKQNNETNPKFHSDWCSMIYQRLKLAKNLLTDDGVIFISINLKESHNMKKICDEIFGEKNIVGELTWESTTQPINSGSAKFGLQSKTESIYLYAKNKHDLQEFCLKEIKGDLSYPHNGKFGKCRFEIIEKSDAGSYSRPTMKFSILGQYPREGKRWQIGEETAKELERVGKIQIVDGVVKKAIYPEDEVDRQKFEPFWSLLSAEQFGTAQTGKEELNSIMGTPIGFDTVKSIGLIKYLLSVIGKDYTILDFFSGSATTAHAVMQLNAEDGGNRKFIMVQLPEVTDEKSEARKANYDYITEIGKERIRRAGEKIKEQVEHDNLQLKLGEEPKKVPDIGFRVLKCDSTNMKDVYYSAGEYSQATLDDMISNIKEDRNALDLLYGVLLDWGIQLSSNCETLTIDGITVYNYDDGSLIACLDNKKVSETAIREIAKMQPLRVVFRDSSFANSPDKINVEEIFKLNAPNTSVRVI